MSLAGRLEKWQREHRNSPLSRDAFAYVENALAPRTLEEIEAAGDAAAQRDGLLARLQGDGAIGEGTRRFNAAYIRAFFADIFGVKEADILRAVQAEPAKKDVKSLFLEAAPARRQKKPQMAAPVVIEPHAPHLSATERERFAYPQISQRPHNVPFTDMTFVPGEKGKMLVTENEAVRLLSLAGFLKNRTSVGGRAFGRDAQSRQAFISKFGAKGDKRLFDLIDLGVFEISETGAICYAGKFEGWFNNDANRAAFFEWARDYGEYRKRLAGLRYAALQQHAAPDLAPSPA